jgi:hypothetical protein
MNLFQTNTKEIFISSDSFICWRSQKGNSVGNLLLSNFFVDLLRPLIGESVYFVSGHYLFFGIITETV